MNRGRVPELELPQSNGRLVQLTINDGPHGMSTLPGLPSAVVTQTRGGQSHVVRDAPHLHEDEGPGGHRILLCIDGLTSLVPLDRIADALRRCEGEDAVNALVGLALAAGGPDNVTVTTLDSGSSTRD